MVADESAITLSVREVNFHEHVIYFEVIVHRSYTNISEYHRYSIVKLNLNRIDEEITQGFFIRRLNGAIERLLDSMLYMSSRNYVRSTKEFRRLQEEETEALAEYREYLEDKYSDDINNADIIENILTMSSIHDKVDNYEREKTKEYSKKYMGTAHKAYLEMLRGECNELH